MYATDQSISLAPVASGLCLNKPEMQNTALNKPRVRFLLISTLSALFCMGMSSSVVLAAGGGATPKVEDAAFNIEDAWLQRLHGLTYDQKPPRPVPGIDYGMDPETGRFIHPKATPMVTDPPSFEGQLDYWEDRDYAHNMEVIAFLPEVASPGHSWQNIVDWGDQRIMYLYLERNLKVIDITDPRKAKVLESKGGKSWFGEDETNPFPEGEYMGAATMAWNSELQKMIMVQSFAAPRFGVLEDKLKEPEGVKALRQLQRNIKGFKVYEMTGPLPDQWTLLAERTTDFQHPNAPKGEQGGSGSHDVPAYYGGKYMYLSAAPDASHGLTEFPDYLWSAGFQTWDMSDPANPKFVSQFNTPGQIIGDPAHEEAYLMNPRAGNRTSWMGSRMPPFFPKPVDEGGTIAFGAMAALGLVVLDLSDPANMKEIGAVNTAPRFAGTEFDNADVSQYERTGFVFANGYPMNDECFEPYKDIWVIDARDPAQPKVAAKFPRPTPPAEAPYTDYCQRRGSFGPKRPGYHVTQPGRWKQGVVAYAFYNAGVQLFDVQDPLDPKIAAYYVPRFPHEDEMVEYMYGNLVYGIYVEYDRNILWMITNHGIYALSSPALGEPLFAVPQSPWPPRD
jgi:hypothetical protein